MRPSLLPLLLLGALGCTAETFGTDDRPKLADATIVPTVEIAWPGAEIELRSEGFASVYADAGIFFTEGFSTAADRVDAVTFRVRLPVDLGAGEHLFEIRFGADTVPGSHLFAGDTGRGSFRTAGHGGTVQSSAMAADVNPQPWPWDAPTGILVHGNGGTTTFVNARTGMSVVFQGAGARGSTYAPGLSYESGVALLSTENGAGSLRRRLNIFTGTFSGDTVTTRTQRQLFELSPNTYAVTTSHSTHISGPRGGSPPFATESPWYLSMSRDRRFGAFVVNAIQSWPNSIYEYPIIDLWTGAIARWVPGIGSSDAVVWRGDSKALLIAARPYWSGPQRLVWVDPETGTEGVAIDIVPEHGYGPGSVQALAIDPQRGWVYDLTFLVDGRWQLRVRDPETLSLIGVATIQDQRCTALSGFPVIIPDPTGPAVQIVNGGCGSIEIYRVILPY